MQIPHNVIWPALKQVDREAQKDDVRKAENQAVAWSSVDNLNLSIGLLYAICVHAADSDVSCAFCTPPLQLLRRWQVSPPACPLPRCGTPALLRSEACMPKPPVYLLTRHPRYGMRDKSGTSENQEADALVFRNCELRTSLS